MSCCSFSKEDSVETIDLKLHQAFPSHLKDKQIVFLQGTKNGDLFKLGSEVITDGDDTLKLIGTT